MFRTKEDADKYAEFFEYTGNLERRVDQLEQRWEKMERIMWEDLLPKVRTDIEIGRDGLISQFPAYLSVKKLLALVVEYLGVDIVHTEATTSLVKRDDD